MNIKRQITNLEKIRLAYSWGWAAVLNERFVVFGVRDGFISVRHLKAGWTDEWTEKVANNRDVDGGDDDITGYLYAGELAGHETIPKGQRFRVKETGYIGECVLANNGSIRLFSYTAERTYFKGEVEPFFD